MRFLRWSIVFVVLVLGIASPAAAQGWGREWLERLSGPGPFAGIGLQFPVACEWHTTGGKKFLWYFQTPEAMSARGDGPRVGDPSASRLLCIDFQYGSMTNRDSGTPGLLDLRTIEGRVGFPLEGHGLPYWTAAFEPSAAAGAIRFQGDGFSEWRLTFSPEITIKPLKFIRPEQGKVRAPNKRGDWRGLIEISYGGIEIQPKITNDDLRVPFLEPFDHGWLQRATWIRVNATELLGLR